MTCPHCNTQLAPGSGFCGACGNAVTAAPPQGHPGSGGHPQAQPPQGSGGHPQQDSGGYPPSQPHGGYPQPQPQGYPQDVQHGQPGYPQPGYPQPGHHQPGHHQPGHYQPGQPQAYPPQQTYGQPYPGGPQAGPPQAMAPQGFPQGPQAGPGYPPPPQHYPAGPPEGFAGAPPGYPQPGQFTPQGHYAPPPIRPFGIVLQQRLTRMTGQMFLAPARLFFLCESQKGGLGVALGRGLGGIVGGVIAAMAAPTPGMAAAVIDEPMLFQAVQNMPGSMIMEPPQFKAIKHTMWTRGIFYGGKTYALPEGLDKELKTELGHWCRANNVPMAGLIK
ncbi:MAG: hypothetical protein H0V17_11725 [Deltaproteobacteria bacterium]|nr:hypothetical protein [Deltaproteobacteria bacterium]